jgi:hypothetical protein
MSRFTRVPANGHNLDCDHHRALYPHHADYTPDVHYEKPAFGRDYEPRLIPWSMFACCRGVRHRIAADFNGTWTAAIDTQVGVQT